MVSLSFLTVLWVNLLLVHCNPLDFQAKTNGQCKALLKNAGGSANFGKQAAHAVHAATFEGLRQLDPLVPERNFVPTTNFDLTSEDPILAHAPHEIPSEYQSIGLRTLDQVLQNIDNPYYDIKNSKPIWRLIHAFHMRDSWELVKKAYFEHILPNPPSNETCACAMDIENNGVLNNLRIIALSVHDPELMLEAPLRDKVETHEREKRSASELNAQSSSYMKLARWSSNMLKKRKALNAPRKLRRTSGRNANYMKLARWDAIQSSKTKREAGFGPKNDNYYMKLARWDALQSSKKKRESGFEERNVHYMKLARWDPLMSSKKKREAESEARNANYYMKLARWDSAQSSKKKREAGFEERNAHYMKLARWDPLMSSRKKRDAGLEAENEESESDVDDSLPEGLSADRNGLIPITSKAAWEFVRKHVVGHPTAAEDNKNGALFVYCAIQKAKAEAGINE